MVHDIKVEGQASLADHDAKLVTRASRPLGRGHLARPFLAGAGRPGYVSWHGNPGHDFTPARPDESGQAARVTSEGITRRSPLWRAENPVQAFLPAGKSAAPSRIFPSLSGNGSISVLTMDDLLLGYYTKGCVGVKTRSECAGGGREREDGTLWTAGDRLTSYRG
jgi:hypothetical protein